MELLKDLDSVKEFFEALIRPLKNDSVYIMLGIARKKYDETLSQSSQITFAREIIYKTSYLDLVKKIIRISATAEYAVDNNKVIDLNSASIYFDLDHKSTLRGYREFVDYYNKQVFEALFNPDFNTEIFRKMDTKLFSHIHSSKAKNQFYLLLDVDKKDKLLVKDLLENYFDKHEIVWVSETRGGYHIIVNKNQETSKVIHKVIKKKFEKYVEFPRKCLTPIPGTLQGGFEVKKYEW